MGNKYKYMIYESTELIAVEVEQEEPLQHLEIGHQLLLSSDDYQQKIGNALVIEHIRICLTHTQKSIRKYEVHVFCRDVERPPPL